MPSAIPALTGGLLWAVGALLAGGGCVLFFWRSTAPLLVAGILATTLAMLFLAPVAIRALAAIGRRAPVSIRLALRDLGRYQALSGAALGAITLAIGIAPHHRRVEHGRGVWMSARRGRTSIPGEFFADGADRRCKRLSAVHDHRPAEDGWIERHQRRRVVAPVHVGDRRRLESSALS